MSFVAVAIRGSALLGAGASIYGGSVQADAAGDAAQTQVDATGRAIQTTVAGGQQAKAYLDPFRDIGLRAGVALERNLYAPEQLQQDKQRQRALERIRLQGEINRLETNWQARPVSQHADLNRQIDEAYNALRTFDTTAKAEQRFEQQAAQTPQPGLEASPWYEFQAELLGRNMDRAFAARGLTGSGFEAEERRRGLIELGAGETERQFGRLKGLYDVGANAAAAGAGAITGTAQGVANLQLGAGQAQAQGIVGVAGANANMATGIANSATGAVGAGLNYLQFQNLINANKPVGSGLPTGGARAYG